MHLLQCPPPALDGPHALVRPLGVGEGGWVLGGINDDNLTVGVLYLRLTAAKKPA